MLACVRSACIKYGAAKKWEAKAERELLERKSAATNRLINLRAIPETDLLEKLDTYTDLKGEMDEKIARMLFGNTEQKYFWRAKDLLSVSVAFKK